MNTPSEPNATPAVDQSTNRELMGGLLPALTTTQATGRNGRWAIRALVEPHRSDRRATLRSQPER
jgi:hypothetical protein